MGATYTPGLPPRKNKFGVAPREKRTAYGITFASKAEMNRYLDLVLLERAGHIEGLERQVAFELVVNGVRIGKYVADFVYFEGDTKIVEDRKSPVTARLPAYLMKKQLMLALYGIALRET